MNTRLWLLTVGVAVVSAMVTYTLTNKPDAAESAVHDEETHALSIPGIRTARAVVGESWDALEVTGKVTVPPDRLVKISPRIEGKVVAAYAMVGDSVRQGETLAVISSVELADARAQYRRAAASLAAARRNLEREMEIARLGAVSVRPVEEARSESLSAQGEVADAKSGLSQAKSELAQAESELAQCTARLQRARELYSEKIISKHDLEAAETEFRRDSAAVDAAHSKVSQAEARIKTAQAKSEICGQYLQREERIFKGRVLDMRSVQAARAEVATAQIEQRAAADRVRVLGASPGGLGETIAVLSPISGRVVSRHTNVGEMAAPSDVLFVVADQSRVWIEADVYEKDLSRVRKGQKAEIRVEAYPGRVFAAAVASVSDVLSPESRTAKVRCIVDNAEGLLRGEMFARVALLTGKRNGALLVEKDAVLDDAGKKIVFTPCTDCPEDRKAGKSVCGSYDRLEIEVGSVRDGKIEVLGGLEPGTEVVTAGAYQIKAALSAGKLEAGCADGH